MEYLLFTTNFKWLSTELFHLFFHATTVSKQWQQWNYNNKPKFTKYKTKGAKEISIKRKVGAAVCCCYCCCSFCVFPNEQPSTRNIQLVNFKLNIRKKKLVVVSLFRTANIYRKKRRIIYIMKKKNKTVVELKLL